MYFSDRNILFHLPTTYSTCRSLIPPSHAPLIPPANQLVHLPTTYSTCPPLIPPVHHLLYLSTTYSTCPPLIPPVYHFVVDNWFYTQIILYSWLKKAVWDEGKRVAFITTRDSDNNNQGLEASCCITILPFLSNQKRLILFCCSMHRTGSYQ